MNLNSGGVLSGAKCSCRAPHKRLDTWLVATRFYESRQKAADAIKNSKVFVDGQLITKPSFAVCPQSRIIADTERYVSRGAYKLLHAIQVFKIDLDGKDCLDIGASTGGFTQVCLENKASRVYAVDVGNDQLHLSLRQDPRVTSIENTSIRDLNLKREKVDFICADVSFVSLSHIIPLLSRFFDSQSGEAVLLIKPQFEVGKENLPKNHIVTDPKLHQLAISKVKKLAKEYDFLRQEVIESPVLGREGNKEFLLYLF